MARQPPKPPTTRASGLGATGSPVGWGRLLTDYWLLLAESHLTRRLFGGMLQRIVTLPVPAG